MRRPSGGTWTRRRAGFAAAAALLLAAVGGPLSAVPSQAVSFVCYFQAAGAAGQPLSVWERLTVSLLLTAGSASSGRTSSPGAEPCRS